MCSVEAYSSKVNVKYFVILGFNCFTFREHGINHAGNICVMKIDLSQGVCLCVWSVEQVLLLRDGFLVRHWIIAQILELETWTCKSMIGIKALLFV